MSKRSKLSQPSGTLGHDPAKGGVDHWWMQRVTAIALAPLSVWFVASIVLLSGSGHAAFVAWIRMPLATISVVILLIAMFYHMALGLQVVIEDYVRSAAKLWLLTAVRLGCLALAVAGILATLRIVMTGE